MTQVGCVQSLKLARQFPLDPVPPGPDPEAIAQAVVAAQDLVAAQALAVVQVVVVQVVLATMKIPTPTVVA